MSDRSQIDWAQARPSIEQFDDGFRTSTIRAVEGLDPRLQAAVASLNRTHGNGGALAAQFLLHVEPAVAWFLARNRLPECGFFTKFFGSEVVQHRLEKIGGIEPGDDDLGFEIEGAFVTLGRLAQNILNGGAYLKFEGDDAEALGLACGVADAAFEGRYSETVPCLSWKPWCSWFEGIAWDASFFWLDKRRGLATVLLVTDTD